MSSESALPWVLIPGFMLDESLWDDVIEHMPFTQAIHLANLLEGQTIPQIAQHIASSAPPRFVLVGFSLGGYVERSLVQQLPYRVAALVMTSWSLCSKINGVYYRSKITMSICWLNPSLLSTTCAVAA
jgi:pimeloyl-ACP methyl ester carboxylesterase